MWLASLLAIVLSFARVNVGDNSDNLFILPTAPGPGSNFVADLSWTLGSSQKIQWSTTLDSYYIALYQQIIGQAAANQLQTIYSVDSGGAGQQSFNWQVQTYNSNISFSPVYFLWLNPGNSQNFTSHYFNITNQAQSSSSSSSSTASTSSTSLTSSKIASSTLSTPPQETSDTPPPTSPSSGSSSTEIVRVGLGVGVGIGVPLVLIAGMWIGLTLVKQRKSSSRGTSSGVPLSQFTDMEYPLDSYPPPNESKYNANQIHEAPGGDQQFHEAPGEGALIELGGRQY